MKVNGKLIFGLFGSDIPNKKLFVDTWNRMAKENGFDGFYFFVRIINEAEKEAHVKAGFKVWVDYLQTFNVHNNIFSKYFWKVWRKFTTIPKINTYNKYIRTFKAQYIPDNDSIPCICPNFDHSPRSKQYGVVVVNSTPNNWKKLCQCVFDKVKDRPHEENIVLIKSWNEWGEGNYM